MPPTHRVYIDDSGTKEYADSPAAYGNTGVSRHFVFGAVMLDATEASKISQKIRAAKSVLFGTSQVEIKSNWLRIPKERQRRYLDPYSVSEADLTEFTRHLYDLIAETDLQLMACVVDKIHMQERYSKPWYPPAVAYEFLMQRVVQAHSVPNSIGVSIDDMSGATPAGNQYKRNLIAHHRKLRQYGASFKVAGLNFAALVADLKFVNSQSVQLIQIADLISYNVLRQFRQYGEEWETANIGTLPSYEWFNKITGKFRHGPHNRIQGFGIVKCPIINRVKWSHTEE